MSLVSKRDIERAATSLRGVAVRTPLLPAPWLSDGVRAEVRLKCENLQHAGAFKLRGAYTMLARLADAERRRGVITYSSGNHGQALALAARMFGVQAVVVMPTTAPAIKVAGAKSFGAEVVMEGTTSTERMARALALAEQHGYIVVPPFDHPDIIAGQGTVGLEILEDWGEVGAVLVPIGGGGLASGVAAYIKQAKPDVRVIGVEPETADAMYQSLQVERPVTIPAKVTIADGLMPVRPGDLTYEHAAEFLDEIVRVSDDAIRAATRAVIMSSRIVVEFSGAATVAALLSGACDPEGRATVAILSGGNLDPEKLAELVA
ncbi:MAG: threonine ammonia-lyase [Gemmatimonadota bacterium]